jgi:two-component sensor histidine kinase
MQRLPLVYVDVPVLRPGTVGAYAFAFVCAGVAAALRLAIDPYVVGVQYITFFPAVIIATLVSGLGAGLFCLVLSVGAVAFFVLSPRFSFYIENLSDVLTTLLFILMTFSNVILIAGMRFGIERYQEHNHKLEQHDVALRERYRELNHKLEQHDVALRETEERLAVMAAELQHRTRNLIGVVGAIADNTMRTSNTFEDFKASYHDRLEALARAQGLLFRMKKGDRVTFDELLNTELAAQSIRVGENGPVTLDGPKGVRLRSGTVQTFAMVLHELVTNAVKYGALKQPNGHLTVRWRQETLAESGKPWLYLDWKESGVEMPHLGAKPQGSGQGRELIERVLPYQFDARTTFALEPDGVHCTISLPASEH